MASADPASDASSTRELELPEIIFSCGICQTTPFDIYARPENNKGFHSGFGDDDGMVTRLWLSECMHVTCGRHLPGGAAPFHPQSQQPQAVCPQCIRDRGDDSPKELFGIRGFGKGEHDAAIPEAWFRCPPVKIEGADPGMDALRFQYVALTKYAQKVQRRWKDAEQKSNNSENSYAKERKRRKQIETELQQVASDAAASSKAHKKSDAQLKKWRDRQPVINHYLGIVKVMADDMAQMRDQLAELGYQIPIRDFQFAGTSEKEQQPLENPPKPVAGISSSSTAVADQMEMSSTSHRKRKQADRDQQVEVQRPNGPGKQRNSSRELMPPPSLKPTPALLQTRSTRPDAFRRPQYSQRERDDIIMIDRSGAVSASPFRSSNVTSRSQDVQSSRAILSIRQSPVDSQQEGSDQFDDFRFQPTVPASRVHTRASRGGLERYLSQQRFLNNVTDERSKPLARRQGLESSDESRQESRHGFQRTALATSWMLQPREPFRHFAESESRVQSAGTQNPFASRSNSSSKGTRSAVPSVIHPFFKRDTVASRVEHVRRPASREEIYGHNTRFQVRGQYATQQPQHRQRESRQSMRSSKMPAYSQRPASCVSQTPQRVQPAPSPMTFQQRLQSTIPPTRETIKPVSRARPFAPFVSSPQQPPMSKSHSNFVRSRISLAPSTSRTEDVELVTVPGIRGGLTRRFSNDHAQPRSSYQNSGPLFLAAGRRSVRR